MNLPLYKPKGQLTSTPIPLFLTGRTPRSVHLYDPAATLSARPDASKSMQVTPVHRSWRFFYQAKRLQVPNDQQAATVLTSPRFSTIVRIFFI